MAVERTPLQRLAGRDATIRPRGAEERGSRRAQSARRQGANIALRARGDEAVNYPLSADPR